VAIPLPPDGPLPPLPGPNPLSNLTNDALYDVSLALYLACGRNKAVTKNKHKTHLCYLAGVLGVESDNRGQPKPHAPFKA
jgi:hypothetical protein